MTSLISIAQETLLTPEPSPVQPSNRASLFNALEAAGIDHVEIPFSGSGDEGFVEQATAYVNTGTVEAPNYVACGLPSVLICWTSFDPSGAPATSEEPLAQKLEDLAWRCVWATSPGWENNEGAEGPVTFHCREREIRVDMRQFYTESFSNGRTF
jgi:hypothetical protein